MVAAAIHQRHRHVQAAYRHEILAMRLQRLQRLGCFPPSADGPGFQVARLTPPKGVEQDEVVDPAIDRPTVAAAAA
jgi:hypothetical protein